MLISKSLPSTSKSLKINVKKVMDDLFTNDIGSRPFFYPMHQQPVLINQNLFLGENYPVAEHLSKRGFYIPSGLALTGNQMKEVSDSMHEVLK